MPFEPATIVVSALVGGGAGVLLSSWKIHAEEGAKRRFAARQTIRKEAIRLGVYMITCDAGLPAPDDFDPTTPDGSVAWTATVLEASHELGFIRRRLIRKRLIGIVGVFTVLRADAQSVISDSDIAIDMQLLRNMTGSAELLQRFFFQHKDISGALDPNRPTPGGALREAIEAMHQRAKKDQEGGLVSLEHAAQAGAFQKELIRLRKAR